MSEQGNVERIQAIYAAFGRGDVAFILDQLTDDVRWVTHLEPVVPWAGDYSTRQRVPKFFDAIFDSVEVTAFEPGEYVVQGETVVSLGEFGCRVRATGKSAKTRWILVWKFRDGRVSSYEQFHDPAIALAFR
jgi:ketosteroid isomerase-like protein